MSQKVDKQRYARGCLDHHLCLLIWYIIPAETCLTKPTIIFSDLDSEPVWTPYDEPDMQLKVRH